MKHPVMKHEQEKRMKYNLSPLLVIRKDWKFLFLVSGAISILSLTLPLYMLHLIDHVFMTGELENLVTITTVAFIALAFQWILQGGREKLLAALIRSDKQNANDFASTDPLPIKQHKSLLILVLEIVWIPVFLITLFLLHPMLGSYAILTLSVILIFESLFLYSKSRSSQLQNQLDSSLISFNRLKIKIYRYALLKTPLSVPFNDAQERQLNHQESSGNAQAVHDASRNTLRLGTTIGMYCLGAILITRSELSVGSVLIGPILLNLALMPLCKIEILGQLFANSVSKTSKSEHNPSTDYVDFSDREPPRRIQLATITHFQKNLTRPVFQDLNTNFALKGIIAFSGPSGSGKSQLMRLLVGADKPVRGDVIYDFGDGYQIDAPNLKYPIAFLPDHALLASGTLLQNIQNFSNASKNEIILQAIKLDIHQRIMMLPNGYETEIDPDHNSLSASEIRLLGWLQILSQKTPLIVIDQPELYLDPNQRHRVMQLLAELSERGSVICFCSNAREFVESADQLFVLAQGKLKTLSREIKPDPHPSSRENASTAGSKS